MVVGMTTVFAFLIAMIGLMRVSSAIIARLPEPTGAPESATGNSDELEQIAVALAVIEARARAQRD